MIKVILGCILFAIWIPTMFSVIGDICEIRCPLFSYDENTDIGLMIKIKLALWCMGMFALVVIGLFHDDMFLSLLLTLITCGLGFNIGHSLYRDVSSERRNYAENKDLEGPV